MNFHHSLQPKRKPNASRSRHPASENFEGTLPDPRIQGPEQLPHVSMFLFQKSDFLLRASVRSAFGKWLAGHGFRVAARGLRLGIAREPVRPVASRVPGALAVRSLKAGTVWSRYSA